MANIDTHTWPTILAAAIVGIILLLEKTEIYMVVV